MRIRREKEVGYGLTLEENREVGVVLVGSERIACQESTPAVSVHTEAKGNWKSHICIATHLSANSHLHQLNKVQGQ